MESNARLEQSQLEFRKLLTRKLQNETTQEFVKGLHAFHRSDPTEYVHGESRLALCMIAQGSKDVLVGDRVYHYDSDHYLITAVQLPTMSQIVEATSDEPYLAILCQLDPAMVRSVLMSAPMLNLNLEEDDRAIDVSPLDAELLDAMVRLIRATESVSDSEFLIPLIQREIIYRLLSHEHGSRLARIAGVHPTAQRISTALETLRTEFDQPLRIPEIARDIGMSVSSFHDHFKRATGMTPLQFQKQLRLREARRLMLSDGLDVAGAGHQVGYRDASHFNRDYKRIFGQTPARDIDALRAAGQLGQAAD